MFNVPTAKLVVTFWNKLKLSVVLETVRKKRDFKQLSSIIDPGYNASEKVSEFWLSPCIWGIIAEKSLQIERVCAQILDRIPWI